MNLCHLYYIATFYTHLFSFPQVIKGNSLCDFLNCSDQVGKSINFSIFIIIFDEFCSKFSTFQPFESINPQATLMALILYVFYIFCSMTKIAMTYATPNSLFSHQ